MSHECYTVEELGEIAELDPNHPRRAHAESCTRCRSLLIELQEFRDPQAPPSGARPHEAERHLRAVLEGALRRAPARSWMARFAQTLWKPSLRPAWGALAAVAAVLAVVTIVQRDRMPDTIVVRDIDPSAPHTPVLNPPKILETDKFQLSWRPVRDADAYRVLFFDVGLDEVARLEAGSDTVITISSNDLPPHEGQLLWQVAALRQGDTIGLSRPGGLGLP